jgi:hypothetical protein
MFLYFGNAAPCCLPPPVWVHAQDYAKRFGRDELSASYQHQDPSKLLPDVDYSTPLAPDQLALIKQADIIGALSQVRRPHPFSLCFVFGALLWNQSRHRLLVAL